MSKKKQKADAATPAKAEKEALAKAEKEATPPKVGKKGSKNRVSKETLQAWKHYVANS